MLAEPPCWKLGEGRDAQDQRRSGHVERAGSHELDDVLLDQEDARCRRSHELEPLLHPVGDRGRLDLLSGRVELGVRLRVALAGNLRLAVGEALLVLHLLAGVHRALLRLARLGLGALRLQAGGAHRFVLVLRLVAVRPVVVAFAVAVLRSARVLPPAEVDLALVGAGAVGVARAARRQPLDVAREVQIEVAVGVVGDEELAVVEEDRPQEGHLGGELAVGPGRPLQLGRGGVLHLRGAQDHRRKPRGLEDGRIAFPARRHLAQLRPGLTVLEIGLRVAARRAVGLGSADTGAALGGGLGDDAADAAGVLGGDGCLEAHGGRGVGGLPGRQQDRVRRGCLEEVGGGQGALQLQALLLLPHRGGIQPLPERPGLALQLGAFLACGLQALGCGLAALLGSLQPLSQLSAAGDDEAGEPECDQSFHGSGSPRKEAPV
ncbi:MAG: hypothetical protein QM765_01335 [Myxococcales bacterium]